MKLPGGLFITFEGADKSGKSTQIRRLAEYLTSQGYDVIMTREPGGTPFCEEIRNLVMKAGNEKIAPTAELLLFMASRSQLVNTFIKPNMEAGKIILCDRFADSTVAYQGAGRGIDLTLIEQLNQMAVGDCWPKLTFLLDLPVDECLKRLNRMASAGAEGVEDRFEQEDIAFRTAVRNGFLALAERESQRVKVIDARQAVECIFEKIKAEVDHAISQVL